ncbi:MAG: SUMF1/EgtB/PvdO family nonheme iron enzyme [Polyangiaceae bacterium]|nr:SUMF1/EgtB/PvdO family nonheme iron enzyme [Polyangiaceae bacterium]
MRSGPVTADRQSVAAWLGRLSAERLIVLNPRLSVRVEELLRVLRARNVTDLNEVGQSLASLLATDETRYQQVLDSFRRTFRVEETQAQSDLTGKGKGSAEGEISSKTEKTPAPARRELNLNEPEQVGFWSKLTRRLRGVTWAAIVGVVLVLGILTLPIALEKAGIWVKSEIVNPLKPAPTGEPTIGPSAQPTPDPSGQAVEVRPKPPDGAHLELVQDGATFSPLPGAPTESSAVPGPWWLRILLILASALGAIFAARWWMADRDFTRDMLESDERAEKERARLMSDTPSLGVPYHVDRAPPMAVGAIDDAATLLGRIARREDGWELDVPPTVNRTIAAGGQVVAVFAPGGRREALLVLVDIEEGSHPYLAGVEWMLDRWKRLGVPLVRYDYRDRPDTLLRYPDHHPIALADLARRTEGMPLLLVSRMALPQDLRGRMDWLRTLGAWPTRAFLDLDPRPVEERRKDQKRIADRIVQSKLPRFPFTREGLVACATALSGGGQRRLSPRAHAFVGLNDEGVEQALHRWAATACCVPDPTWEHLDSLRRELPEIHQVLPEARFVQRLIDWVREKGYGEGQVGLGASLRFNPEARCTLLAGLRREDQTLWPNAPAERLEHRARRLLLRQLQAAKIGDDAFEKEKRAMKMAVHRAILGETKVDLLLNELADSPVARELRDLLGEELKLREVAGPADSEKAWSVHEEESARGWVEGRGKARLGDLVRWGRWGKKDAGLLVALVVVGAVSWATWWGWERSKPQTEKVEVLPPTWKVVLEEAEKKPLDATTVALADKAPMRFVHLPWGRFTMGSSKEERARFLKDLGPDSQNAFDDETQHPAEVSPFEIAIHEVTQKQWKVVMGTTPFDCQYGCGDDLPANMVSWIDAVKFLNALTDLENKALPLNRQRTRCYREKGPADWEWDRACTGYRLPTEAEWEYAARAGTTTAYSFGDDPKDACQYANGADRSAKVKEPSWTVNEACDDGSVYLSPVGHYKPNPWGLFDMHGTVWEWVWDRYGPHPDQPVANYAGPSDGLRRVLRGGSFRYVPRRLRSSLRVRVVPTVTVGDVGFRCIRVLAPAP